MQGDLAGLSEDHQLGELVVGADDVADDVALGGDDVQRRDGQRASVADDVVGAGASGHLEAFVLSPSLGDEVQHHVATCAVGQLLDRCDVRAVRGDRVVRPELLGELEGRGIAVHDDDPRCRQRSQALDPDVS